MECQGGRDYALEGEGGGGGTIQEFTLYQHLPGFLNFLRNNINADSAYIWFIWSVHPILFLKNVNLGKDTGSEEIREPWKMIQSMICFMYVVLSEVEVLRIEQQVGQPAYQTTRSGKILDCHEQQRSFSWNICYAEFIYSILENIATALQLRQAWHTALWEGQTRDIVGLSLFSITVVITNFGLTAIRRLGPAVIKIILNIQTSKNWASFVPRVLGKWMYARKHFLTIWRCCGTESWNSDLSER